MQTMQQFVPQPECITRPKLKGPILVVEDDILIREVICEILEDAGYQVESATCGSDGLRKVSSVQPALVLLDMRMPGLDGWEFADALKRGERQVPVVVMTAAVEGLSWATSIQAQGYISKPFDVDELVTVVEHFTC
ncbi:MAG TPA: response regulator [Chloroflexia bacterium]|jgi:CheY-like chemotaxis protein